MGCRTVLGGLLVLLAAGTVCRAATSTQEQADGMRAALERYVGHGPANGARSVTVTPEGDHYLVSIDLKQALRGIEMMGLTLEMGPYSFVAMPLDDSLWQVTKLVVPRITVKRGGFNYSVVMNGATFDGLFDPRIPAFKTSSLTYDSMSIASLDGRGATQTRTIQHGKQTSTATALGDGTATIAASLDDGGLTQEVDTPAMGSGSDKGPAGAFTMKSTATANTVAVDQLRIRALTDLWAFLVAHADPKALETSQDDLRGVLRQVLPVFDHWTQTGNAEAVVVDSPVGSFSAKTLGGRISVTGLQAQGDLAAELHIEGLTIPGGLVPTWVEDFIPTSVSLTEDFTGFHLDAAARTAVDSFDLKAAQPLSPQVLSSMKASLGSPEEMKIAIGPAHIASKLLSLDVSGDLNLRQPVPDFHLTIGASSLDKALEALQAVGSQDPRAGQAVAVLVLAKGLAKTDPDGMLKWIVTRTPAGQILVNGLTLPGSQPK